MAKLRINGDSSGYVDLEAPNAASSSTLDLDQVPQKNASTKFDTVLQVGSSSTMTNAYGAASGYVFDIKANSGSQSYMSIGMPADTLGSAGLVMGVDTSAVRITSRDDKRQIFSTNNIDRMTIHSTTSGGGAVTMPYQPSFYARLHASFTSTTTAGEIVPASSFSSQWNTGSGFSGNRFTAPVAGKYMFIFSAEKANNYSSVSVALSIFKNGAEFPNARLYDSNQNTRKTLQYTMIMDMAVNDYAEPFIYSYQTGSVYDNRGQFAGFLIG